MELGKPAVRKRRPGGGRKPSPTAGAVASLSLRIDAKTRGALEAEAAKSGQKLSRVVERLLMEGIEDRGYQPTGPLRALGILIESIERASRLYAGDGKVREWNSDPTAFEVFRLTIAKLLEKLQPPGEIDRSTEGPLVGQAPEERAEVIFRQIWADLLSARPPVTTKEMVWGATREKLGPSDPFKMGILEATKGRPSPRIVAGSLTPTELRLATVGAAFGNCPFDLDRKLNRRREIEASGSFEDTEWCEVISTDGVGCFIAKPEREHG